MKMLRDIKLLAALMAVLILGGCSRTVTTLPTGGNQLNIQIKFRGNVDAVSNKYYILLGSSTTAMPLAEGYFFAPGEDYDPYKNLATNLTTYYTSYYSTWNDFVVLKSNIYYIVKGPFNKTPLGNIDVHNAYRASYDVLGSRLYETTFPDRIILSIDFARLSTVPAEIYFNIVCVDASGNIKDYLRATDNKISIVANTMIPEKLEPQDMSTPAGLDIVSWSMKIQ